MESVAGLQRMKVNRSAKDMAQLIMQRHWRRTDDAYVTGNEICPQR